MTNTWKNPIVPDCCYTFAEAHGYTESEMRMRRARLAAIRDYRRVRNSVRYWFVKQEQPK